MTGAPVGQAEPPPLGRLGQLRALCELGGAPQLALWLFETNTDIDTATRSFARHLGVLPPLTSAPFPDLLRDPATWPAD